MGYNLPNLSIRFSSDFKNAETSRNEMQTYTLRSLEAFMYYVLNREQLTIKPYLNDMGHLPYFLLASTGLGKTVAAPIHSYLTHCSNMLAQVKPCPPLFKDRVPRLWVIEPKISIAKDQAKFMNELFSDFIKQRNNPHDVTHPILFACRTSVDNTHMFAPIKFVTTGIFAVFARLDVLNPQQDCVLIDESHVTIESSEGVELAIAICRLKGIPIHYMSATVDTANLRETLKVHNIIDATKIQRKPKWIHNTRIPMEECIVDLVDKTLVNPEPTSAYFPQGGGVAQEIRESVLEKGRAKGILIVVNSFAGEESDANKVATLLKNAPYADKIKVILLSGSIIRDPKEKKKFDDMLAQITNNKEKYAIIATSVVEMGVTFPTLDIVVTMDSGYEQVTVGDVALPEITPLPVNSMLQRIGRVGRKFPGIGYITNEVGAYYSDYSDEELNSTLQYEPIKLPLQKGSLTLVAQYSFKEGWEDPIEGLRKLDLPSGIHKMPERVEEFLKQRQRLLDLGVAVDNQLTPEGRRCERWLEGGVDLGYAIEIQEALARGDKEDVLFYLVAAALSSVTLSVLCDREAGIVSEDLPQHFEGKCEKRYRKGVVLRNKEIELSPQSEVIALYNVVCYFTNKYANLFYEGKSMLGFVKQKCRAALISDCAAFGFEPERVEGFLDGFTSILKIFCDTNANRDEFTAMFGSVKRLNLADLTFASLSEWDTQRFMKEVEKLPNRTKITVTQEEDKYTWKEAEGNRQGVIYANTSCLDLQDGQTLTAKLLPLPGRGSRKVGDSWKLVHAQFADIHALPPQKIEEVDQEDEQDYEIDDDDCYDDDELS